MGWYGPDRNLRSELEYATTQFSSLEINGTFYGMQRPDAFAIGRIARLRASCSR